MAQLCAGAMYATRPSFHFISAISESGECPVPKRSRTNSELCAPRRWDRGFESPLLHGRVSREPDFLYLAHLSGALFVDVTPADIRTDQTLCPAMRADQLGQASFGEHRHDLENSS